MPEQLDSQLLHHTSCDACGSSDANAVYDDGHSFCFACETYTAPTDAPKTAPAPAKDAGLLPLGEPRYLQKRGISEDTCRRWGYTVGSYKGQAVQIANYRNPDTGEVVAQKVRFPDKSFMFLGNTKDAGLYGQHLWKGGKRIVITEGEIDALSVAQALNNRWPVASLPNGASSARKALSKALDWLNGFEQIVLCFDNDDPGHKAVQSCVSLFPPGKVSICNLPLKDPNEMIQQGRTAELVQRLWEAKEYRPDGIVTIADIRDAVLTAPSRGKEWFSPTLDECTYGRRLGECVGIGAGTGVGKSDFLSESIVYDILSGEPVAAFLLEQQPAESIKRIAGKLASKRFHIPGTGWTHEELDTALTQLQDGGKLFLYDHFGACDWTVIRDRIRYLAHSEGVQYFYLDHLTALAAGQENEREALEQIMAEIGGLVKELNIWLCFVSHLATPDGKPHEEGGRVMIRHFKGSRSIGFWSHHLFGLERNQQAGEEERDISVLRVLKDRYTGLATGKTIPFKYDHETGRLNELPQHAVDTVEGF